MDVPIVTGEMTACEKVSDRVRGAMPKPAKKLIDLESLAEAAECLKLIAHPLRLRMIQMMLSGRYTVGEIAEACEIASHMASEHLRLMQRGGLLISEREGRRTYYRVTAPELENIMKCIETRFG